MVISLNCLVLSCGGVSFRTVQRKLAISGVNYSTLLDQLRFEKARDLLKESDVNMLEITLLLGYENASTFSRAFKKWPGLGLLLKNTGCYLGSSFPGASENHTISTVF